MAKAKKKVKKARMTKTKMKPMPPAQMAFIQAYFANGRNATDAYRQAHPGTTYGTCGVEGHRCLKKPKVAAEIRRRDDIDNARYKVSADNILAELSSVAFSDVADVYAKDGAIAHPRKMPARARRAIESITTTEGPNGSLKKVKLSNKLKALEILAKQQGMLIERTEISLDDSLADRLRRGLDRARTKAKDQDAPDQD